ncbi:hypothetical protein FHX80_12612 [Streptomyces brevispora]|uniref:DNA-directed RNA polymerase specialized sigma24 family protein n=1 Tax=Streptomyces brevispora TaxID=887462 RepID=A0A561TYX3_9ACTN|nr:hypothetical protein [Streptomyces brevispora]TWF92292.1 hypothetical protein FHX80_12612 [Streptomyces brevispora]
MAMLCHSNLEDDDRIDVSALHAALEEWVLRLLADTQDRTDRLPVPFTSPTEDGAPEAKSMALRTIRFLRHAQDQLLDRNVRLRYLCQDCCADGGRVRCPLKRPSLVRRPVHEAVYTVRIKPMAVQRGAWLAHARPAGPRVLERLLRMAKQPTESALGPGERARRRAVVRHTYEMVRLWSEQRLPDHAVNMDQERDSAFARDVMDAVLYSRRKGWDTDARHSPVNFVAAVLHTLAGQLSGPEAFTTREAVMAALVARNACIEGDTTAVDEFSRTWLNLGRPQAWRPAVEMALLGDWVNALGRHLRGDAEVMELLHRHTEGEHRFLRPLWERKTGGRTVRLLEDAVASGVSLRDVITDSRRPEDGLMREEMEDSRVLAVLADLAPAERAVAMAYGTQRMTWCQAAALGGAVDPDAFGNRVRRKLRRLGLRHRAASSPCAPVPTEGR